MAPRPAQLALAAVSGGAALLCGLWILRARAERPTFQFLDDPESEEQLLELQDSLRSHVSGPGEFRVEPLDEQTARALFPIAAERYVWDADRYYAYRPNLERAHPWPEHPRGRWVERTNDEGLREDGPATLVGADLGVLVAGDSHASGSCDNADTFSELLQADLAATRPGQRVEVLNAAVPGYSFYNYLGVLTHFERDAPDVVVVAVYGGNDFYGALKMHHFLRGTVRPPRRKSYWDKVDEARERSGSFLAQSLNQVLYFQEFPEEAQVAVEAAVAIASEMRRRCARSGTRLLFVYIPPAFEVGVPELEAEVRDVSSALGLTQADLFVSRSMRDDLFLALEGLGVPAVDMEPVFRASDEPCFWTRDLHISTHGQRLVADELGRMLARDDPPPALAPSSAGTREVRLVADDGTVLVEGHTALGLRDGEWIERYPGGETRSRGTWRTGLRVGEWTWWYENGRTKKSGRFDDERPVGTWRDWYRSGGPRTEGEWRAGRPDGPWREWHEDGALASEGQYVAGREEGEWRLWHADGTPRGRFVFRKGRYEGPCERLFPGGAVEWRGSYAAGKYVGPWVFGWPNGQLASQGTFVDGLREGPWTFWKENGRVDAKRSGTYVRGERTSGAR